MVPYQYHMKQHSTSIIEKLYLLQPPPLAPEPYLKAYRGLAPTLPHQRVPWNVVCPDKAYRETERLSREHAEALQGLDLSYYHDIYLPTESVFDALQPAKINSDAWNEAVSQDKLGVVQSFQPNNNGYAMPVEYSRLDTVTGRLKVVAGPNILHLPRSYRNILESRWDGGHIVSLDYRALEPLTLLQLPYNNHPGISLASGTLPERVAEGLEGTIIGIDKSDIYMWMVDKLTRDMGLETGALTRKVIKGVLLAQLYGASKDTIKEGIPVELHGYAELLIHNVKVMFDVDGITSRLRTEWISEPSNQRWITSFYGRRITTTHQHTLLNHYIQSTAVDIAMLGFKNLIEYMSDLPPSFSEQIIPLFVLHDALIMDVHPNRLNLLSGLGKVASTGFPKFPDQTTMFPLSIDKSFNLKA